MKKRKTLLILIFILVIIVSVNLQSTYARNFPKSVETSNSSSKTRAGLTLYTLDMGNYQWSFYNFGIWPGDNDNPFYYPISYARFDGKPILYSGDFYIGNENLLISSGLLNLFDPMYDIYPFIDTYALDYMDSISQEDVISGWKAIHEEEGAWLQKLHVGCTWRTLQWDYPNCDEFIPAIWTIFNYEDQPTDEFYITLIMDWDIDYFHYENNAVQYYPEYWATRMYNLDSDLSGGIVFLSHLPYTMKATSWNDHIWDTFVNTTKWSWDNIISTQEFSTRTEPDDYRVFHVVGPFSLAPGEEMDIAWAFVFGNSEEDWLENVQTLVEMYCGPGPIPEYPPDPPFIKLSSRNNQVKIKWTRNRIELPFYEYEQSSESTVDRFLGIRDWDGYRIYRNLTGTGKIEDGDWHFITELNSTYVYDKWGTIPNEELDPRYWTTTYWAEFTDKGPGLYNGFQYFYSVVAYDFHEDHSNPEKNAKSIIVKGKTETVPDKIIVSPNPYKPNPHPNFDENIIFSNLPPVCTIKIFTSNGTLIKTIKHTDRTGTEKWNLKNDRGNKIASGIYFFVVSSEHGTKKGKIAIIK